MVSGKSANLIRLALILLLGQHALAVTASKTNRPLAVKSWQMYAWRPEGKMSKQLVDAADNAIKQSLQDGSVVAGTNEPSEVARLVNALPGNLVHAWSGYVASGALTVSAAFCHAKPRVSWASPLYNRADPHEPELGDLLLVMDVQGNSGRNRRALLIQAKKPKGKICTLSTEEDLVQRYMYANWWPPFRVLGIKAGVSVTPPQPVDISTPTAARDTQARYAIVRSNGSKDVGWFLEVGTGPFDVPQPPTATEFKSLGNVELGLQQTLGEGLVSLYSGTVGRDCRGSDDWSKLVAYLEAYVWEHTAGYTLPHVKPATGAAPSALVSATSFLSPPRNFVRFSQNRHLLFGMDDWMNRNLFLGVAGGGALYSWPQYNRPLQASATLFEPQQGFGVIQIVVDHPLEINA